MRDKCCETIQDLFRVNHGVKVCFEKVASLGGNTLNFTDLGSPYEGPPSTPQSGMDAPDAPHTPKYGMDGATGNPGKSAFVELQQHG